MKQTCTVFVQTPYCINMVDQCNCEARTVFDYCSLQNFEWDLSFPSHINISNECVFHVDGKVNTQFGIWGSGNPHEIKEVSCGTEKVQVEGALSTDCVIKIYYLDDTIVAGDSYLH